MLKVIIFILLGFFGVSSVVKYRITIKSHRAIRYKGEGRNPFPLFVSLEKVKLVGI
jgi:hypothetical protein